jgi:hypothetical protein
MQITLNISDEIGQALLKQPNPELFVQKALQMMLIKENAQNVENHPFFGMDAEPENSVEDVMDALRSVRS